MLKGQLTAVLTPDLSRKRLLSHPSALYNESKENIQKDRGLKYVETTMEEGIPMGVRDPGGSALRLQRAGRAGAAAAFHSSHIHAESRNE